MIPSESVCYQNLFHIQIIDPQFHFSLLCFITSAIDPITRCDKKGVTLGGGQEDLSGLNEKSCVPFVFSVYDLSRIVHMGAGVDEPNCRRLEFQTRCDQQFNKVRPAVACQNVILLLSLFL